MQAEDRVVLHPGRGRAPGWDRAAGEAHDDDPALEGDDLGGLGVRLAAHGVVDHVGAPAAGGFLHGGDDVLGTPVDDDVAAQLARHGHLVGPADHADDGGARRLPQLHGRAADPSGGGVDEQRLTGFESGPAVQAEPPRLVADVQGGRLGVVEGVGRGSRAAASATAYSAKPPCGSAGLASTRRPSSVSPQISTLGCLRQWRPDLQRPRHISTSGKLMFAARTLSRTCPSPGTGRSTSWSSITWLGSPSCVLAMPACVSSPWDCSVYWA